MTVLFCDVVDSTGLAGRIGVEPYEDVMSRYHAAIRLVIETHGGVVEKFVGDAVLAVFGVPAVREDDAERALNAAVDMGRVLDELNARLREQWDLTLEVRIGINSGQVLARREQSLDAGVLGDVLNVAARLQEAAAPREIVLGSTTHDLVKHMCDVGWVRLDLKGKGPVDVAKVIAVKDRRHAWRPIDREMVGRDAELQHILARFAAASEGERVELLTVLGPPGIGKSRLLAEVGDRLSSAATVLVGGCRSYGEGALAPLAQVVAAATRGAVAELEPGEESAALRDLVAGHAREKVLFRELSYLLGLGGTSAGVETLFWAMRALFAVLSRRKPLLVIVEDIHWAQPALLDLLEHVASWSTDAPALVVCSARHDLLEARPGWNPGGLIRLAPLDHESAQRVAQNLLGAGALPSGAWERLRQAAGGNPLFMEQLLAFFEERGSIAHDQDGSRVYGDSLDTAMPRSVHAVLASRLDALKPEERDILDAASVIGDEFTLPPLHELCSSRLDRLPSLIQRLIEKDLLQSEGWDFPGEATFRFQHVLVRDVAYGSLSLASRARLHERLAEWLDAHEQRPDQDEVVGFHLERAASLQRQGGDAAGAEGIALRACRRLRAAGMRAQQAHNASEAARLMARAAALLPTDSPERIEMLPELAEALVDVGELEAARATLGEALKLSTAAELAAVELRAATVDLFLKRLMEPSAFYDKLSVARDLTERLQDLGDVRGAARAWRLLGIALCDVGRQGEAVDPLENAIRLAREINDVDIEAGSRYWIQTALINLPTPPVTTLLSQVQEHLEWCREVGARAGEVDAICHLGYLYAMAAESAAARAEFAVARQMAAELGAAQVSWLDWTQAEAELLMNAPHEAERLLRALHETFVAADNVGMLASLAPNLGESLFQLGRLEEASELASKGEAIATQDDFDAQVRWRRLRAKLLAVQGDADSAMRLAREAIGIADQSDSVLHQAEALVDAGEVAAIVGDRAKSHVLLNRALALFEAKGNVAGAARALMRLER